MRFILVFLLVFLGGCSSDGMTRMKSKYPGCDVEKLGSNRGKISFVVRCPGESPKYVELVQR